MTQKEFEENKKEKEKEKEDLENTEEDIEKKEDIEIVSEEEESVEAQIKKIRENLKECQKLKDEYLAGWQRARADFINARKDEEKEREEFIRFAQKNIVEKLLALADNFDLAFVNRDILPKDGGNWLTGMENTRSQLMKILEESGVAPLENSTGKKFNPSAQEAIEKINTPDPEKDNLVLEEAQRGYKMYDKILRPAKVKVGIYIKVSA